MTAHRPFTMLAAGIFLLIAIVHVYRVVFGFDVAVAGTQVSQSVSWIAILVTGLLAAMLHREARR